MLPTNSTTRRLIGAAVAALALVSAACSSSGSATSTTGTGSGGTIKLVAYSTPQAAYTEIEAAFQKTAAGKGVHFQESYGASGDQSRAVAAGQPADYVAFSLEPDVTRLVKAGLVASTWNAEPVQGHGHQLDRGVRRAQGQPQEHPDLGRPDQAGRQGAHAQPVLVRARPAGTSWPPTAPS